MTVHWMNILHFYQPPFQDLAIVEKVTDECYLPVTKLLLDHPNARCIINITGCLLDMLDEQLSKGKSVISNLSKLIRNQQIEITGTGKYHPIFPLIPKHEIEQQIHLQENSLKRHLGVKDQPSILFLPEMAYLPEQAKLFKEKGYTWVIIDESSLQNGTAKMGKYQLSEKESECKLLVRDREISESLGNSIWQQITINSSQDFINHAQKKNNGKSFVTTATDVEVFGHHQKNRWKLLEEMYTTD
jgi:alpha-amylase/alpha-mannosidase (GH57 family)